jgi:hypothetical protein
MRFYALIEVSLIPILLLGPVEAFGASPNVPKHDGTGSEQGQCVKYDSVEKLIRALCKSVHLTDIYNNLSELTFSA